VFSAGGILLPENQPVGDVPANIPSQHCPLPPKWPVSLAKMTINFVFFTRTSINFDLSA